MKFTVTFIFLLFTSIKAWPCSFPISGTKYNDQVKIIATKEQDVFKFIVPAKMEGLDRLEINLGYAPINTEFKFMKESKPIRFKVIEGNAVGSFAIENRERLLPFLHVMWWPESPGLCGVIAVSEFVASNGT